SGSSRWPARAYRSRTGDAHGRTRILPTMRPTTQISSGELCSVLSRTDAQQGARRRSWPSEVSLSGAFGVLLPQPILHVRRDQARHVTVVLGDLAHEAGGKERVLRVRRHEHRLHTRESVVHLGDLELVVEVTDRTQAANDGLDAVLPAEVDKESVELGHPDVAELGDAFLQHVQFLRNGEQAAFVDVVEYGCEDFVVLLGGSADDVDVSVGHRVERTRADYSAHGGSPLSETTFGYRDRRGWLSH